MTGASRNSAPSKSAVPFFFFLMRARAELCMSLTLFYIRSALAVSYVQLFFVY